MHTTFLDHPRLRDRGRALQLPLMPLAWRYATRETYDVVVTSSHACAKGFWPARTAFHLCYCYTPMRYAWLAEIDRRGIQLQVPDEHPVDDARQRREQEIDL
mgnify:CR=1 FL=1